MCRSLIFTFLLLAGFCGSLMAQLTGQAKGQPIEVAVPFLLISADGKTASMGEAGSALPPTEGSLGIFNSKTALLDAKTGFVVSYTPWLKSLVSDRKLMNANGFYMIGNHTALSAGLAYLSYGDFDLVDDQRISGGGINPAEYAVNIGVSKAFGESFTIGTNLKYINSTLYTTNGAGAQLQSGRGFAVDVSYFNRADLTVFGLSSIFSHSVNIMNIGPKMAYFYNSDRRYFLPTVLKLGTSLSLRDERDQSFNIAFDVSKPLVPARQNTYPGTDASQPSVLEGMLQSFSDSPGGFKGEMKELAVSIGAEYLYQGKLAFRTGYNFNSPIRGLGHFASLGAGFKHKSLSIDLSYIIGSIQNSFLGNSMRLSFGYSLPK